MVDVTAGYPDFFETLDPTNCQINSCTLFNNDCSTLYSSNSNLGIDLSSPYKIQARKDISSGFSV